ncbi:L,D-transpeptidase family protein [Sphingobacterium detergens]|uniref:L,D-transpeptidase-like protein n=1 Tax=Sphingobacterium detergens TaxID=1145106 RepID=A0A420BH79_SPHD1|nr:L,D-transpeptidase family protein [Sphingobacterium detergens]RKE56049.1 L,D-transpeptidase-like protein [Sphingobacterium detergens]
MKAFLNFIAIFLSIITTAIYAQDLKVTNEISSFLKDSLNLSNLNYPKSVIRFYTTNNYEYLWLNDKQKIDQASIALSLLIQPNRFGLLPSDYHLENLSLERLKELRSSSPEKQQKEKAQFEILMTDGLLSFINNLHFGKYNPLYQPSYVDSVRINGFCADEILSDAGRQDGFLNLVHEAQPKFKAYQAFQDYLDQAYAANNTMTSPAEMEKILINMERLRWINTQSLDYILINIPSYTLEFHYNSNVSEFKVVVGKPKTATPILESEINYFSTAPDWRVPQSIFLNEILPEILENRAYLRDNHYSIYDEAGDKVIVNVATLKEISKNPKQYRVQQSSGNHNALGAIVFRFQNSHGVYIHDTPQKQFFNKDNRALSHGCIRVQNPKLLATQLLEFDNSKDKIPAFEYAVKTYGKMDIVLKQPVPIIITYLTMLIKNGKPTTYNDIYQLDQSLEDLFNENMPRMIAP